MSSITEKANSLIVKIQEHMNTIEMADIVIEDLNSGMLVIEVGDELDQANLVTFEETLTPAQLQEAKNLILCMLNENKKASEAFLAGLTAEPAAEPPAEAPTEEKPKRKGGRPRKMVEND
jgi:hypothetical protein